MNKKDARARVMQTQSSRHQEQLASAERKWEFRYNNQDKRIKELEETIKTLRGKIRELKKQIS